MSGEPTAELRVAEWKITFFQIYNQPSCLFNIVGFPSDTLQNYSLCQEIPFKTQAWRQKRGVLGSILPGTAWASYVTLRSLPASGPQKGWVYSTGCSVLSTNIPFSRGEGHHCEHPDVHLCKKEQREKLRKLRMERNIFILKHYFHLCWTRDSPCKVTKKLGDVLEIAPHTSVQFPLNGLPWTPGALSPTLVSLWKDHRQI